MVLQGYNPPKWLEIEIGGGGSFDDTITKMIFNKKILPWPFETQHSQVLGTDEIQKQN